MPRTVRAILTAACTAIGLGLLAAFVLPRLAPSNGAAAVSARLPLEAPDLAIAPLSSSEGLTSSAPASRSTADRFDGAVVPISYPMEQYPRTAPSVRRLPPVQRAAYEDVEDPDERLDRLERSMGRLVGMLEQRTASRVAQAQDLSPGDLPLPDFAPGQRPAPRSLEIGPQRSFEEIPPPPPLPSPDAPIDLETSRDIPLRELIHLLGGSAGFNVVVSPSVEGTVSASLRDVTSFEALTALLRAHGFVLRRDGPFLFAGNPGDFSSMDRLDDVITHRVYRPRFVTAHELQVLLQPILTETGQITVTSTAEQGIPVSSDQSGGDAYAGEEVLLIRDFESILRETDVIVADVDRMPLQAAIEAVILSVELDDEHRCGVNLELLRGSDEARIVSGTPTTTLAAMDFTDGGLNIGFLDANIGAFISALEEIGDTQVVARPRLTCINKQRAEILIGDQIGYLSTTQTETATTQTVEFLDVGTQLRLRPFISPEGIIRLEVHPELSSGEVKLVGDTPLPEKTTTQVTTNILCRDGATIVLGGLIREETIVQSGQIPIIGNVPYMGALFRRRTETTRRTELIVLITPRILRDPLDGCEPRSTWDGLTERQPAMFENQRYEWLASKRHGDQYGRLAQSAYIAGNYQKAYRYASISLQFDSRNPDALKIMGKLAAEEAAVGRAYPSGAFPEETLPRGTSNLDVPGATTPAPPPGPAYYEYPTLGPTVQTPSYDYRSQVPLGATADDVPEPPVTEVVP